MDMRLLILILSLFTITCQAGQVIGVYVQDPIADTECAEAFKGVVEKKYKTVFITPKTLNKKTLKNIDLLVFGGGLGDSDQFDDYLTDKKQLVSDYVKDGGRYLGICMGAYFAGHYYFDILKDADTVRYVKRPNTDIISEDETVASVKWNGRKYIMYFFDGCAITGTNLKTYATYNNGDTMAAIQNRIGLIGCHPESMEDWFITPELKPYWHKGIHHKLLLSFVDELMKIK